MNDPVLEKFIARYAPKPMFGMQARAEWDLKLEVYRAAFQDVQSFLDREIISQFLISAAKSQDVNGTFRNISTLANNMLSKYPDDKCADAAKSIIEREKYFSTKKLSCE